MERGLDQETQISVSTSGSVKESDLVQFVSGITGQNTTVTAEKITSSLDVITGRVITDERVETQRQASSKSDEAWNVGASFSVGKDGVPNPGLSPNLGHFEILSNNHC